MHFFFMRRLNLFHLKEKSYIADHDLFLLINQRTEDSLTDDGW